jgi:glucosamine--fructose-6-phosphate aminotransferase (isomerizing)
MCGIIGILGERPAAPLLLEALRRLEYRGYDSAGVATLDGRGCLRRVRAAGKLSALEAALAQTTLEGTVGIGHTRWATHGAPTEANAHPHISGPVAVVHNGIIENHKALRAEIESEGGRFETDTDTEVVAQLCARAMARGAAPLDAAAETLARLDGAFALCFLFAGAGDLIVCARRGSPLAIGFGEGETYVGSDAIALAPLTTRIAYLEEGDWAALTRGGVRIFDASNAPVERAVSETPSAAVLIGKDGHRHFMAKEIHEQPAIAAAAVAARLSADRRQVLSPAGAIQWAGAARVSLIGCGTAHYAGLVGKYWFERIARLHADVEIASEWRYREPALAPGGVVVFVSQSGETADTLAAMRHARDAGQTTLAIVNVETSTMAREADVVLPILAGPEIGVASTKAFTAQLIALLSTAVLAARSRGALDAAGEAEAAAALARLPRAFTEAIATEDALAALAADLADSRDALFLGRGAMYPLALEGALKLKELTYMHAEGYAAGELKHGPIALIDEAVPVIAFAPHDALFEKTVSNLEEVRARKGRVVLVTDAAGAERAADLVWRTVEMPTVDPLIAPIVYAVPAQLLAYHAAVFRGTDVDQPRNLAKSVTVE